MRAEIVVPDVVMHQLLVPEALAGRDVDGDERRAIEVVARARHADVIVLTGDRRRDEDDAALGIDGEVAPRVGAANGLPRLAFPRLVVRIAWLRHQIELP